MGRVIPRNGSGPLAMGTHHLLQDQAADLPDEDGVMFEDAIAGVESLDYEVVESFVNRENQARKGFVEQATYVALKWLLALLIGIATGLAIWFINLSVENFAGFKFSVTFAAMRFSYFLSFLVYAAFNTTLVLMSAVVVCYYAPASAGSGIPEIKGYLNGIDMPGILLARTLVGKVVGSIGSVAGGLALGKEGPLVHTGACIASLLGQGGSTKYHVSSHWVRLFKNDRDRRDLVTIGSAAGVSAAFRAPVGGVLFALEEMSSWWRPALMWRVFFASAIVAVTVRTAMGWCTHNNCGHFGSGGFIVYELVGGQEEYHFSELLPMALIGVVGGILGALYNQLTALLATWRRDVLHPRGKHVKVMEACAVALLTSLCSFCLPLLTTCTPCPDPEKFPDVECPRHDTYFGNFVSFNCASGAEYNDLATLFFNTQDDTIRNLFSTRTYHEYSPHTLLAFLVIFYTLSVVTFGIAVPAGQFVPGIMVGATYGRLVGMLVVHVSTREDIDEGTYALLGAASFLGGSMRMTVSLCVIMAEITNNLKLLPLIMLVLLVAKAVGDGFTRGFYEVHAAVKKIPLLEPHAKRFMREFTARDAVNRQVVPLSRIERVGHIVSVLQRENHHAYPVLQQLPGGEAALLGTVLRSHLISLLIARRDFHASPAEAAAEGTQRYDVTDFSKPVSSHGRDIEDVHLSPEERAMFLDLLPFVNASPYFVSEDMALNKVYSLFRHLGLRHLMVVPAPSHVSGVITRKDLLHEVLEEKVMGSQDGSRRPRIQQLMRRKRRRSENGGSEAGVARSPHVASSLLDEESDLEV
ncbi:chloride channel protein [Klebsormidium nitens]|uniref:Chloride channel protein n=1 Tax=Klebsormidium nitens TaxID=105231 RepID=A0A1Y1IGC4_KLENI|nr:chloride channel protein [Klebsormidium nitens]|eukprot:GAQ87178.1 chloride channel protein [Klebsormidium nitens]